MEDSDLNDLKLRNLKGWQITPEQVKQCRDLYCTSYGIWSSQGPHPGQFVKASVRKFSEMLLFNSRECGVVIAMDLEENLVGQAFYVKYSYLKSLLERKEVLWITQLVVREDHRDRGVASGMIRRCLMENSDVWACGLVSCNPYALKALEAGTKRRCRKDLSAQHAMELIRQSSIPYVQNCRVEIGPSRCAVQTNFYVDHAAVDRIRASLLDWQLESLMEFYAYRDATGQIFWMMKKYIINKNSY